MDHQPMPRRASIELLGRCLAFRRDPGEHAALREQLFASPTLWGELTDLAVHEDLAQPLEQSLRACALLPSQFVPAHAGAEAADCGLIGAAMARGQRREALARELREVLARLNRVGIAPIVIKGAQSLLTGEPAWRSMADFDLLAPDRAEEAQAQLMAMGYSVPDGYAERTQRHHLPPLLRDGCGAAIEIHRRSGNQYVRTLLPTRELADASIPGSQDGVRFRLLPLPLHVLYGVVHNHVGHAGDARGNIILRSLYEFAWDMSRMGEPDRIALKARADRHPRLGAALDMWIAAAAELFRLPVEAPFAVRDDAVRRWKGTLARIGQPRPWYKYPGYPDEIRMGLAAHRVRAAPGGAHLPGRMWTRTRVIRSFFPRFAK
ncbi:MAG TPA: nucleotidyltransferase family protein [Beijerinckiaceae bacterium]|nr:nucleotidyltransferase family protein [Beijerinckiaceae bacterium]